MLSKDKITEIKQALNIVDVIGETVALTKAGRNYVGLALSWGENPVFQCDLKISSSTIVLDVVSPEMYSSLSKKFVVFLLRMRQLS